MERSINLSIAESEQVCKVAKALSSPVRIAILNYLESRSCNVNELASGLNIPASSAGLHIRVLEDVGLVLTEQQPGEHGSAKLCSKFGDTVTIRLRNIPVSATTVQSVSMPIGEFYDCEIHPTCGIGTNQSFIGDFDSPQTFFLPERIHAQILWSASGFVEYRFPNILPKERRIKRIFVSLEICSEAPNYRENWKSDITMWINQLECGTWQSPGDFGLRRGRLTPAYIQAGHTQHGLLTTWTVSESGSLVNEIPVSGVSLHEIPLYDSPYISVRIGNKPTAKYIGGFSIFGRECGDYPQDIIFSVEYE